MSLVSHVHLHLYSFLLIYDSIYVEGAIVVVILWWLDLLLPMQSVPITTNVVSSNPAHGVMYSI